MTREVTINQDLYYLFKEDHRDNTPIKSQWTITEPEEQMCFETMHTALWHEGQYGWGLHVIGDRDIDYLGVGVNRDERLFIAKFVNGNNNNRWHGYPADYKINYQDIPSGEILSAWESAGYITSSKVRKIIKGQPCKI